MCSNRQFIMQWLQMLKRTICATPKKKKQFEGTNFLYSTSCCSEETWLYTNTTSYNISVAPLKKIKFRKFMSNNNILFALSETQQSIVFYQDRKPENVLWQSWPVPKFRKYYFQIWYTIPKIKLKLLPIFRMPPFVHCKNTRCTSLM